MVLKNISGPARRSLAPRPAPFRLVWPEGAQRTPLARARHPPYGGSVSGAVVGSSAREGHLGGKCDVFPVPQPPRGMGGTRRHHPESPQEPIPTEPRVDARKTTSAS
jgi:hypothetical protein